MLIDIIAVIMVFGLIYQKAEGEFIPRCEKSFSWFRHPQDCRKKYQCFFGRPIEMPGCGPFEVFNSVYGVCVRKGSSWDDCSMNNDQQGNNPQLSIKERCANGEDRIPHPEHCARYYDCGVTYKIVPRFFEQHLVECEYPTLFNANTKRCDNFENVQCGDKEEPVDGCDYIKNKCPVAHCKPCIYRYPSCKGKSDGLQAFPEREGTPYYMECYKNRMIKSGFCEQKSGHMTLFSPVSRKCESVAETIDEDFRKLMPICGGEGTGLYPVEQPMDCTAYYACNNGEFEDLFFCQSGKKFNRKTSSCMDPALFCGTCGEKRFC